MQPADKQPRGQVSRGRTIGGLSDRIAYYFARGAPDGGGSNFGVMCERAALKSHTSMVCPKCEGLGFREVDAAELRRREERIAAEKNPEDRQRLRDILAEQSDCLLCRGVGRIEGKPTGKIDLFFTSAWCGKCHGCGEVLDEDNEDRCPRCDGEAYIVPVTCKPTGDSGSQYGGASSVDGDDYVPTVVAGDTQSDGYQVGEETIAEFGRMSRMVEAVRRADPLAAAALAAFYGPDGDRYRATRWGAVFALWPLTRPGQTLVADGRERSKQGHGFLLKPLDMLASERNAEASTMTPNVRRRALIGQADKAARQLLERAERLLAEVASQ